MPTPIAAAAMKKMMNAKAVVGLAQAAVVLVLRTSEVVTSMELTQSCKDFTRILDSSSIRNLDRSDSSELRILLHLGSINDVAGLTNARIGFVQSRMQQVPPMDHQSYARIVISLMVTENFDGEYGPGKVDKHTNTQFN